MADYSARVNRREPYSNRGTDRGQWISYDFYAQRRSACGAESERIAVWHCRSGWHHDHGDGWSYLCCITSWQWDVDAYS